MRDKIILGRYLDTGSWVHSLDPRAKIAAMLIYFAVIMTADSLLQLLIITVFSLGIMRITKIPFPVYFRAFKPLRFLILFIFVFPIIIERDLEPGTAAAVRMLLFVSFTAILTFTTSQARLTQGLEEMLQPLKAVGISPQRWTLMITIALRFIPTILEEAEIILKAQASRGADFNDLALKEKARMLISLLVPIIAGAFRRAGELIESMESRGYRLGAFRSKFHVLAWDTKDTLFIAAFVLLVILNAWERTL